MTFFFKLTIKFKIPEISAYLIFKIPILDYGERIVNS